MWKQIINRNGWLYILTVLIIVEFMLAFLFKGSTYNHWLLYICPLIRLIDYIIGGVVRLCLHKHNLPIKSGAILIIIALLTLGSLSGYSFYNSSAFLLSFVWTIPVMILIGGLDICGNSSNVVNVIFSNRFIIFIGEISFEFFLVHQLIIRYLNYVNKYIHIGNCVYLVAFLLTLWLATYIHKKSDILF